MAEWQHKKVIITGATGFVGANMAHELAQSGAHVTVLARASSNLWRLRTIADHITVLEGDLLDAAFVSESFQQTQPDIVYHFAYPGGHPNSQPDRINMLATGLLATQYLLHAAKDSEVKRFVHIGSSTEYGPRPTAHSETDAMHPVSIRGVGKAASTLLCAQFAGEFNFPVNVLRLYAVYGKLESQKRFVPSVCRAAISGKPLPLTQPGIMHDWIFVEDVIAACLKTGQSELTPGDILNIGSGEQHANEEIVALVEKISGKKIKSLPGEHPKRDFDTAHWQANISKAKTLLDWQPNHSLYNGLEKSYQYWVEYHSQNARI